MSQVYGREVPSSHQQSSHRARTRFVVVVPLPEGRIARLLLPDHSIVAEFDASTEEVTSLIRGLVPAIGLQGSEWDAAMAGATPQERAATEVYVLEA